MKHSESYKERKEHFKRLSSKQRQILIWSKLKTQGLEEGSGV